MEKELEKEVMTLDEIRNSYEMKDADGIGVYVGTYRKYNEGSLFGMWIDLEKFTDADEFFEVCRALHADEEDPEFMFQDYQGFPASMYFESMCEDEIQDILDYVALDDDDKELLEEYQDAYDESADISDIDKIKERYCGTFDSMEDYAENFMNERYNIPDYLANYIDYSAFARDLEMDGYYISSKGFVFDTNR